MAEPLNPERPASRPATHSQVTTPRLGYRTFFNYAVIAVSVAVAPALIWKLSDVILLAFGAVLVALLISLVAEPFQKWTPVPSWLTILLAGFIVLGLFLLAVWIFGSQISAEFSDVTARVESAGVQIQSDLGHNEAGKYLLNRFEGSSVSISAVLEQAFSLGTSTLEALVVIVISAIYLVAQPRPYQRGLMLLLLPEHRDHAEQIVDEVGRALRLWLIGQMTQMIIVGLLSTLAVWLLGLPSVLALGLIATVTEFVPYLGPIIAAIPAVLVALTQSPQTALWTLLAYLLIHQIEGNLVTPLVQRWLIVIPPAMMLLGIAAIGTLFGFAGIVFAGPIVTALYVIVKKLYVRDTLGDPV